MPNFEVKIWRRNFEKSLRLVWIFRAQKLGCVSSNNVQFSKKNLLLSYCVYYVSLDKVTKKNLYCKSER